MMTKMIKNIAGIKTEIIEELLIMVENIAESFIWAIIFVMIFVNCAIVFHLAFGVIHLTNQAMKFCFKLFII